jgi:hypothetical protein
VVDDDPGQVALFDQHVLRCVDTVVLQSVCVWGGGGTVQ